MKIAQNEVVKAVYEVVKDTVIAPDVNGAYELSYIKRVTQDGGAIITSQCLTDTGLNTFVPAYTSQTPTFDAKAYIYIYGLNTIESGPSDSFIYDCAISVKCALSSDLTTLSEQDLNTFGNTVADVLQPTTFSQITVTGFAVVDQQLQAVNYSLPAVRGSRYEYSVTLDWIIRVEEI